MGHWVRELLGWVLMGLGLLLFLGAVVFVSSRQVVEAALLSTIGAIVFRAGIHLMKVAVAARVYQDIRRETGG